MSLNTVTTGNTILAADINQLVNVLQRASGQNETGKYYLQGGIYANGASISEYMASLSRVSVPASVTIDTADQAPANGIAGTATQNLTANGFLVYATGTTGPNTLGKAGGNTTISF